MLQENIFNTSLKSPLNKNKLMIKFKNKFNLTNNNYMKNK